MNRNDFNPFLWRYRVRARTRLAVPITMRVDHIFQVSLLVVERGRCSVVLSIGLANGWWVRILRWLLSISPYPFQSLGTLISPASPLEFDCPFTSYCSTCRIEENALTLKLNIPHIARETNVVLHFYFSSTQFPSSIYLLQFRVGLHWLISSLMWLNNPLSIYCVNQLSFDLMTGSFVFSASTLHLCECALAISPDPSPSVGIVSWEGHRRLQLFVRPGSSLNSNRFPSLFIFFIHSFEWKCHSPLRLHFQQRIHMHHLHSMCFLSLPFPVSCRVLGFTKQGGYMPFCEGAWKYYAASVRGKLRERMRRVHKPWAQQSPRQNGVTHLPEELYPIFRSLVVLRLASDGGLVTWRARQVGDDRWLMMRRPHPSMIWRGKVVVLVKSGQPKCGRVCAILGRGVKWDFPWVR